MASVETVIVKGAMEDDQGRILHPDTEADQVVHSDGETSEKKLGELVKASETMTASMAAAVQKVTVDLAAKITLSSLVTHTYRLDVLEATAEGESPVATVYSELIGQTAVFYRGGINATKEVSIKFRLISVKLS